MLGKIKIDKPLLKQIAREKKKRDREQADTIERKEKPPVKFNLPNAIIVDIDGVLAIRGERGIYEFGKCAVDTVCQEVKQILEMIKNQMEVKILIMTGREEIHRGTTERWLLTNTIPYDTLYMRSAWDGNKGYIIKKQLYETFIKDKFNVLFVMEDEKYAIKMWKAEGLYVFNCDQK